MKHLITICTLLLSSLWVAAAPLTNHRAQGLGENQRVLGYTTTDDIDVNGAAFGTAGTYSIGAIFTPDMLASYAGCRIQGIRLAAALELGRTRTFLYSIVDGAMSPLVEQRQKLYTGWQNIMFNGDGIEITGTETLFFGFDYVETDEMVAAEQGGICAVGQDTDGAFYLYQNSRFYSIGEVGKLCIQLIVDVSSLPLYNLDIASFDVGHKYKQPGEAIEPFVTVRNVGRSPISTYRMGYQLDEQPVVYQDFPLPAGDEASEPADGETQQPASLAEGQTVDWQFTVGLPADAPIGTHRLRILALVPSGDGDATSFTVCDELTKTFAVYRESVERSQTYMEVYTDQSSPYAPYLNDALKVLKSHYPQLAVANIHRPGTPLAVSEAAYLHELYAYTWPTFTSNRSYFPGEAYIAYDMNDYLPVIGTDMTAGIISGIIEQDFTMPSFATVSLQAAYDADSRQLTVDATGTLLPEASAIYGDLALTLLVVEDGVKDKQAVYNAATQRTTINQNYEHNQVLRTFLTAPTGDVLQTVGDGYSYHAAATLDSSWQPDRLTVIALLTKYADAVTDDNVLDMDVINCNSIPVSQSSGIAAVSTRSPQGSSVYYTLDGKRISDNQVRHGLYIERRPDGSTRKIYR